MSACDICPRPGRCCSGLLLAGGTFPQADTVAEADEILAKFIGEAPDRGGEVEYGLPFRALFKNSKGQWMMWCPNLTRAGRCGDYENRPYACRDYKPGTDDLCALYTNEIARVIAQSRLAT